MKLLMILPSFDVKYGGPASTMRHIPVLLEARGIQVDLVTLDTDHTNAPSTVSNEWIVENGYRMRYFSTNILHRYGFSISLTKWLFENAKSYNAVHVHGIFSYVNLLVYLACDFHKIPYIVSPHGMLEPWAICYKPWKKKIYYVLIEKKGLAKAAGIHAVSSPEAAHIEDLRFKNIVYFIPNAIRFSEFESLPPNNIFLKYYNVPHCKHIILFLGRLHFKKGVEILVAAFAKLAVVRKDIHLILAGPVTSEYSSKIRKYLLYHKCLDAVTFTGVITGRLKLAALSSASVFVLPSFSEGLSVAVLEAMAAGLPSIITTGCNFPEAEVAEVAKVIQEPNIENIDKALKWYLDHTDEAHKMGTKAREWIRQNYSYDVLIDKHMDMYSRILKQPII